MVEEKIIKIANKIKKLRLQKGLSIREAARLAGTSPATIQKIESNGMVPSIAILMKIAMGLNKSVSYFLGEDAEPRDVALVRKSEREVAYVSASRLKVENLGSSISDGTLEVTQLTIEKNGSSGKYPLIHRGEEVKYCLEGKIVYTIDEQEYILNPGDCIHFRSDKPHFWKNIGKGNACVLSVCSPPPYNPAD